MGYAIVDTTVYHIVTNEEDKKYS